MAEVNSKPILEVLLELIGRGTPITAEDGDLRNLFLQCYDEISRLQKQDEQVAAYHRIFAMSEAWAEPANVVYQNGDDLLVRRIRDLIAMSNG